MLNAGPRITDNRPLKLCAEYRDDECRAFSCFLGSIEEKPEEFKFDVHHTLTVCFVNLSYFDKNRNARCL